MEPCSSGAGNNIQEEDEFERSKAEIREKGVKKATRLFFENVAISGLEPAWKTSILAERVLMCVALVVGFTGIAVTMYCNVTRRMQPTTVYDDFLVFGQLGPFPNITVCSPMAINKSKLLEILVIPQKVRATAARKNIDINDIIDFALDYWDFDIKDKAYENRLFSDTAQAIMDATAAEYRRGMAGTMMDSSPLCEYVFTECYFYGQPFKCCDAAQYVFLDGLICYYFAMTRIHDMAITAAVSGGKMEDTVKEETSGLLLRINVDWELASFHNGIANGGYHIFIGPLGTILADPVAIPTGADAIIALSSPYHVKELDKCCDSKRVPRLYFQEYYDQYGINCVVDKLTMIATKFFGCDLPFFNNIPPLNETQCSSAILFHLSEAITGGGIAMEQFGNTGLPNQQATTQKMIRQYQEMGNAAAHMPQILASTCRPLCTRWVYPITSASYGYVQHRGQSQWEDSMKRNQTWSRIRVFFPEAYYHLRSQKTTSSAFQAIWDTGGVLGVYLGASVITLVEVMFYGLIICWAVAKEKVLISETIDTN